MSCPDILDLRAAGRNCDAGRFEYDWCASHAKSRARNTQGRSVILDLQNLEIRLLGGLDARLGEASEGLYSSYCNVWVLHSLA